MQEDDASVAQVGPIERGADGLRGKQTDGSAQERANHVRNGDVLETQFEGNDQQPENHAEDGVENRIIEKRPELKCGITDGRDEQDTREYEPRHDGLQGSGTIHYGQNE